MFVQVDCYAGYKAEERPVRFCIDGYQYGIEEVIDRWYGPNDTWYKVRAQDGNLYVLRHRPAESAWEMVSFSKTG